MPKVLVLAAFVISALLFIVFLADALIAFPFRRPSLVLDILFIIGAALIGYLAFETYREVT